MSWTFVIEQMLNGLQFGLMLFLLAAGLTLVFGIMDTVNLAHGSLYMLGAYLTAAAVRPLGSYWAALALAVAVTGLIGVALERTLFRRLYQRDHLTHVMCTSALILLANELVAIVWGRQPLSLDLPPRLAGPLDLGGGLAYSSFRLVIMGVGLAVALCLYLVVHRTRQGMWLRAGASNRDMARVMGVRVSRLFTFAFGVGAALCALAGGLLGPLLSVQIGMGEDVLILAFVVIVIGGIGSIRGAFAGALIVGMVDTLGAAFLPLIARALFPRELAGNIGPPVAAVLIYAVMAGILVARPRGLFPARS